MRSSAIRFVLAIVFAIAIFGAALSARANVMDLALARFIECNSDGTDCRASNQEFEKFIMEYAYDIAPRILAPAETLGYSGFYMGLEGTLAPRFGDKDTWIKGTTGKTAPDVMFMPAVHIRKGLPWSFEIGSTVNYLVQSELVGLGGEVKWSLFEGYRHGFRGALPDLSVSGQITRILGESDLDMTIVGADASISYAFGIGGMVTLTPYAGFQYLWTIVRVEPLVIYQDNEFHLESGGLWNSRGLSEPNLGRAKVFGGFRFGYEMLAITLELDWGIRKKWDLEKIDCSEASSIDCSENDKDSHATTTIMDQIRISGGIGMDF